MNGAAPMTPTQEDREAAAKWSFGRTDFASFSPADRFEVEEVAKFIAGIRLAAEERGARMALEAAAKVADEMGALEQENFGLNRAAQNYFRARNAIRQIDPAALGAE